MIIPTLLALAVGYLVLTRGPGLFVSATAAALAILHARRAAILDAQLLARRGDSLRRLRDGRGWHHDRGEQRLLARSLRLTLIRTCLFSQYPAAAMRGMRLAHQLAQSQIGPHQGGDNSLA